MGNSWSKYPKYVQTTNLALKTKDSPLAIIQDIHLHYELLQLTKDIDFNYGIHPWYARFNNLKYLHLTFRQETMV